jgi:hypothetical protein
MRTFWQRKIFVLAMCMNLFTLHTVAQESVTADANKNTEQVTATKVGATTETNSNKRAESKPDANKAPMNKKMVQDATISLQTTITGNQEQPKVLYILPWQSPQMADVDFEPLDSQQKAVFNHVERDELRRELETADAIKD